MKRGTNEFDSSVYNPHNYQNEKTRPRSVEYGTYEKNDETSVSYISAVFGAGILILSIVALLCMGWRA